MCPLELMNVIREVELNHLSPRKIKSYSLSLNKLSILQSKIVYKHQDCFYLRGNETIKELIAYQFS